ncbi:MAG: beta-N-acetylhexosaminidase [Litoreibacter sp.]|nr:beta-N-acetylhexosaminidase [Litoreibacter sp.]
MVSNAYIFGCAGEQLTADESRFFASAKPWGFILFARNVADKAQLKRLTDDLRDAVGWQAPILIDQEGGRVQRMRGPIWQEFQPALDQMQSASDPARAMYLRNRLIASDLHEVGIDVNCAPVADVLQPETHPVMKNRCYSEDVETAVAMCREAAKGFLDGGVLPVLKHIPGYGRAVVDGHLDLPRVDVSRAELDALDFAPFKALNDIKMGMTAHIVFPVIDDAPATTSPKAMQVIRKEIGFEGLIMTDDISMKALSGSVEARCEAALAAGCDLALHCNGKMEEMAKISERCGPMSEAAQSRAKAALAEGQTPSDIDIPAARAEFEALIKG